MNIEYSSQNGEKIITTLTTIRVYKVLVKREDFEGEILFL